MSLMFPILFMDPPQIINMAVTPIPGSGSLPLQIIADSGKKAVYGVQYLDSSGDYIGIYLGKPGFEVLLAIIGNSGNALISCMIPVHSRISIRSLTTSAITAGLLSCNFMGYP